MNRRHKSGQILILVLLVVVVALGIGLSVASRNLTNLKTSTQAEQSQRAFSAAEGGVENTLSKLNLVAKAISTNSAADKEAAGCGTVVLNDNAVCDQATSTGVQESKVTVKANKTYERLVETGDVAQINLAGVAAGSTFKVKWAKSGENTPNKATLEFTFICDTAGSGCFNDTKAAGVYGQHREAFTIDTISSQGSGFIQCNNAGVAGASSISSSQSEDTSYGCTVTVTVPAAANLSLLRVKPFWNRTTVNVSSAAATFPVQTYEITSTATTDSGLSRKVEVKRDALPQLPAVFDYVLYSGKDIIK